MKTEQHKKRAHKIRQTLAKAIRQFSQGYFSESWHMLSDLDTISLSDKERKNIHKLLNLLVLGEFFGYHNFCQLLDVFHLKTHHLYRLWKTLNHDQITTLVEHAFWLAFRERLLDLCSKSDSTWSRMNVTVVIDSSIYKQILSHAEEVSEFDKFFSGQYHATVYGFRLTLLGIVIGKRFYPIRFYISSKEEKELDVAMTLLGDLKQKLGILKDQEQIEIPNLFLSVDSGFCHAEMFAAGGEIPVISVPKKSWVFDIDGHKMSLNKHIARLLEEEQARNEPVFPLRKRAIGNTLGDVVLLFFRFASSQKVSVIVTDKLDIFATTLRRRWFQRTYIEQFFRFSKHTLNIQSSKSTNAAEFDQKASINFLKVLVCQTFTNFCREQSSCCQTWSFEKIRTHLIYDQIEQTFLKNILFDYDDLLHNTTGVTA